MSMSSRADATAIQQLAIDETRAFGKDIVEQELQHIAMPIGRGSNATAPDHPWTDEVGTFGKDFKQDELEDFAMTVGRGTQTGVIEDLPIEKTVRP